MQLLLNLLEIRTLRMGIKGIILCKSEQLNICAGKTQALSAVSA